jgi:hypothetical protein
LETIISPSSREGRGKYQRSCGKIWTGEEKVDNRKKMNNKEGIREMETRRGNGN